MRMFHSIHGLLNSTEKNLHKFADTLDYSALGPNWQSNPDIVEAAANLYRENGVASPFYQAYMRGAQIAPPNGTNVWLHGSPNTFSEFNPNHQTYKDLYNYYKDVAIRNPEWRLTEQEIADLAIRDYQRKTPFAGWFTDNTKIAKDYASGLTPGVVYPVYLKSEKPFVFDAGYKPFTHVDESLLLQSPIEIPVKENFASYLTNAAPEWVNHSTDRMAHSLFSDTLADSMLIKNVEFENDALNNIIAVRNPTQIKSIYNRGTFDPTDPNIYRSALAAPALGAAAAAAFSPSEARAATLIPPSFNAELQGMDPAWYMDPIGVATDLIGGAPLRMLAAGARAVNTAGNALLDAILGANIPSVPDEYYEAAQ